MTVRFGGEEAGRQVRLLDLLGREVLRAPATGPELRLSLVGVAPGCYLLNSRGPSGARTAQRLIVQP